MRRADIARALNTPNTAIYAYEKRDSLKTSTILRICYALKYNFFMDIANSLPRDFEQSASLSSDKDDLIKQQAAEINKLQLENNLLKELIIAKQK
jgi:hypothetical protein